MILEMCHAVFCGSGIVLFFLCPGMCCVAWQSVMKCSAACVGVALCFVVQAVMCGAVLSGAPNTCWMSNCVTICYVMIQKETL